MLVLSPTGRLTKSPLMMLEGALTDYGRFVGDFFDETFAFRFAYVKVQTTNRAQNTGAEQQEE